MTEQEYQFLVSQVEHRYALAGEEYKRDLDALHRSWVISQTYGTNASSRISQNGHGASVAADEKKAAPATETLTFMDRIRKILPILPGEFTLRDAEAALVFEFPGQEIKSLSSALKRLAEGNEISCTEQGKGRRPSKFSYIEEVE